MSPTGLENMNAVQLVLNDYADFALCRPLAFEYSSHILKKNGTRSHGLHQRSEFSVKVVRWNFILVKRETLLVTNAGIAPV